MNTMQMRSMCIIVFIAVLTVLPNGCGPEDTEPSQSLVGRWEVINKEGMNLPNSFFWFAMDYVEFREGGEVWGLTHSPPGAGGDIRLNKTAEYVFVCEHQIEFVGACRHQDPCTGSYSATMEGDELQIFDAEGRLELRWVGPPSKDLPPKADGPSPSPTPDVAQ
jgi:hypothetical protein